MSTISSVAMPASNAMVSKLYGTRRGISGGLNQDALSRDCSMLIDIHLCGKLVVWSIWLVWFNQINETAQSAETAHMNKTGRKALWPRDYLLPGSTSNPPQLGPPSSEGIGIDLYSV